MEFDSVHPSHRGPNTVYMTREKIAKLILGERSEKVLDLPCGTGSLTQMLLENGVDVTSADLNPSALIIPGRSCIKANLNGTLPFDDETFDALACIEGVEHIENPHQLAREANRVLRKGGRIFISTPNVLSIRSRMSNLLKGFPNDFHYMIELDSETGMERPIDHINPVGFLELRYILSRWGFQVDLVETNRILKRNSLFYRMLRLLLLTRGKRSAASSSRVAAVRQDLLSDQVLFGEALIIGATKVSKCPNLELDKN